MSSAPRVVVSSALAIVIDDEALRQRVDAVRRHTDSVYPRWMPHMNILYPFYESSQFGVVARKLEVGLGHIQPFTLRLRDFGYFPKPGVDWIHFEPSEDDMEVLQQLYDDVTDRCPGVASRDEFKPHLTLAQFPLTRTGSDAGRFGEAKSREQLISMFKAEFPAGIDVTVNSIALIERSGAEPFRVTHRVPLGRGRGSGWDTAGRSKRVTISRNVTSRGEELRTFVLNHMGSQLVRWLKTCQIKGNLPRSRAAMTAAARSCLIHRMELWPVRQAVDDAVLFRMAAVTTVKKRVKDPSAKPAPAPARGRGRGRGRGATPARGRGGAAAAKVGLVLKRVAEYRLNEVQIEAAIHRLSSRARDAGATTGGYESLDAIVNGGADVARHRRVAKVLRAVLFAEGKGAKGSRQLSLTSERFEGLIRDASRLAVTVEDFSSVADRVITLDEDDNGRVRTVLFK